MFADLSGFTPLTAAMGDHAAAEVLSRFAAAVRRVTAEHDGRVVKQIGDAFMLVFDDRRAAVLCGAELLAWCAREPRFPPLHVGAHAGEVLFHDGDYVGTAVNLAARVASTSEPAQFLVTDALLDDLDLPQDVALDRIGERQVKGLLEAVALTAVSRRGASSGPREHDPVCGMALDEAAAIRPYVGRTWAFCSTTCAEKFDTAPDRYTLRHG
jgi:class 3 adenylate cyclase/YHS domain-containing protein